jgi:hypothetical protein
MSEDLAYEIQAITAIYGDDILQKLPTNGSQTYALSLKQHHVTLRLCFPFDYPAAAPPDLQGTESVGITVRKGHGTNVLQTARQLLADIFVPGQVCLFDLIEALEGKLVDPVHPGEDGYDEGEEEGAERERGGGEEEEGGGGDGEEGGEGKGDERGGSKPPIPTLTSPKSTIQPNTLKFNHPNPFTSHLVPPSLTSNWTLSTLITEKRSTFLARACPVTSPSYAQTCIANLLSTDKRAAKATHNITAYRIRMTPSSAAAATTTPQLTFQDCNDDGESAAGGRVLHLLQVMDAWGVLVVVSRWFGGVKLGPDRFRIINQVVREVVVKGGWGKGGGGQEGWGSGGSDGDGKGKWERRG